MDRMIHFEIVRPIEEHRDAVFHLRNDEEALKMSFHREKKEKSDFKNEFKEYFALPELPPLFISIEGEYAGFISFKRCEGLLAKNSKAIEISIVIAPKFRGVGIGTRALIEIIPWIQNTGFNEIVAEVKKENLRSAKAFLKAGYEELEEKNKFIEDTSEIVPVRQFVFRLSKIHGDPVFIIAEAGSNWKVGSSKENLEIAKKMIEAASESGANAVKFQTFKSKTTYVENAGKSKYLSNSGVEADIQDLFDELSMPYEMVEILSDYAKNMNIEWMSTPFSIEDFKAVDPFVKRHKIASYEIGHPRLIQLAAESKKPLILSTGAATEEEIAWAVRLFFSYKGSHLTLMQCTASYPAPSDSMNLSSICWLKKRFKVDVGLSDHSLNPILAPVMAVSLGGKVIEKHFTLDKTLKGPDHAFSLNPKELKSMVQAIREAEKMKGSGYKSIHPSEEELRRFAKRGIQAIQNIKAGTLFKEGENIAILRPGNKPQGIHPRFLEKIEGKTAKREIPIGDGIRHGDF